MSAKDSPQKPRIVHKGRYLKFVTKRGWEYVERINCSGIAVIVAINAKNNLIFVEQYREPLSARVIEFPAGLTEVGLQNKTESLYETAERELLEETGYSASKVEYLTEGPVSSGLSTEVISIFRATELKKVSNGGGDHSESIKVHEVPLNNVESWLDDMRRNGYHVDPKVYAGLYFIKKV